MHVVHFLSEICFAKISFNKHGKHLTCMIYKFGEKQLVLIKFCNMIIRQQLW